MWEVAFLVNYVVMGGNDAVSGYLFVMEVFLLLLSLSVNSGRFFGPSFRGPSGHSYFVFRYFPFIERISWVDFLYHFRRKEGDF